MDPNVTLYEIQQLVGRAIREDGLGRTDTVQLAELTDALDEWLGRGGFLPDAWKR